MPEPKRHQPPPAVSNVESKPEEPKPAPAKQLDVTEHLMTLEELEAKYQTKFDAAKPANSLGLSAEEAAKRLAENGPNMLTPPPRRPGWLKFLDKLRGLFNLIMLFAGVVTYILYGIDTVNNSSNVYIGGILIAVAFLNSFIEYYQEAKSQAILESFLNLIPSRSTAVRGGVQAPMSAVELVAGDVVYLRLGDKVPADCVIVAATDLKVDNSSLTGESEPQERTKRNTNENPLEATNLVFNGTLCVNGDGYGIVVRTGDNTVIGQIAKLTTTEKKNESPLSEEITLFVYKIASVAFVTAVIFFIIGKVVTNLSWAAAVTFAIGTFVAWVPQGLPATVTMLLSIAAKRMASRNVLVKDLQGVETLGAITLLATDKTGTLTRNQMTVSYLWTGLDLYTAQVGGTAQGSVMDPAKPGVMDFLYTSALCTKAKFDRIDVPVNQRWVFGDATEAGLLRCAATRLPDADDALNQFPKVFEVPFNSENKWAMTINKKSHSKGALTLFLKGAPERVLRLCDKIFDGKDAIPLEEAHKKKFDETYKFMASKGHRVLAFAKLDLPGDQFPENFEFVKDPPNYPNKGLVFQGLVSLEDPPKHGVREAIGHCREAGVQVMMVTGDHPLTAEAIGRKINLMVQDTKEMVAAKSGRPIDQIGDDEYDAIVIHGEQIDSLSEKDWENIFSKEEIIFARTSPKHKLQIVKHAQSRGHIVGVTGDGVNDSPALKKADLGIAMNISGSDVSKEAAAMVLLDDNFASTVSGIEEGRLIFLNLKKSVRYIMTHILPEVWAQLAFVVAPIPYPLTALQIVFVDLGFELFNGLSFAFDPAESKTGLMKLQPRKPVTDQSIERILRKQARQGPQEVDPETGHVKGKSAFSSMLGGVRRVFTAEYWRESFEETDEEVLVDAELLSYCMLEMGTIETIGAFITYFVALWHSYGITPTDAWNLQKGSSDHGYLTESGENFTTASGRVLSGPDQFDALRQAQSAFFLAMLFCQCWNLFLVKAKLSLPWGWFMISNKYSYPCILFATLIAMFIVYPPFMNIPFSTSWRLSPLLWLIPIGWGFVMWAYVALRIVVLRKIRPIKYSQDIAGLQMFPTRWCKFGCFFSPAL
ncbi:hypothetical protein M427DRAFT_93562 [Gonapodya prolifera JEL478]|uniref:Cation-transporting P-type ATPase N-terminal domain-containing protein n=1 Tax=Gonapodya prolifera (strain JEL478) TaxID=1344416 RepID=A0A139AWN6_GONPJ|nr:hypothetical protein M427DRAFT_93562 [Gonapodya prolifera JEL478]|eukprot:KXS21130.1 hypothetical protein M427DRAFT_93562 [Gonapodya prolifera JEL478]